MIATFNAGAGGPYIGMDDSYYDGSLYFGTIGDFTELGEYGYYYVGSHEAYISYYKSDEEKRVYKVLKSDMMQQKQQNIRYSSDQRFNSRNYLGTNLWRNGELILENHFNNNYKDTVYEPGEYCYFVNAVYSSCESDTTGLACETFYVGLEEGFQDNTIKIYPNPAREELYIESPFQTKSIQIMNTNGMIIRSIDNPNQQNIRIDCKEFKTGLLFLRIATESEISYKKVLILH
ncbi:MAG: T9SS type A sorting domain-containing protein [Bacteroidota bacterium]|nr:T9SS type A sorting domain-containing protein [Bacteroidota bacterium]